MLTGVPHNSCPENLQNYQKKRLVESLFNKAAGLQKLYRTFLDYYFCVSFTVSIKKVIGPGGIDLQRNNFFHLILQCLKNALFLFYKQPVLEN